jgi:polar amino acid transport system substrate-binding protein
MRSMAVMIRAAIAFVLATGFAVFANTAPAQDVPRAAIADLAPTGKLRAAINFGNPILAKRDPVTGEAHGVSVDLARELSKRLGVPAELVLFGAAGKVTEALQSNAWDVAFVAIDPARAVDMEFTAPYVIIEGAYLVPQSSPIAANADVDREGVRVVVGAGSAYDLYLSRELKKARVFRAPTSPAVTDMMVAEQLDVAAGVRQQLEADAKRIPGMRLLDGRFMVIQQAMATPKGRTAGARFLVAFVEEMKASGFVARALTRNGVEGVSIAPPADRIGGTAK